MCVFLKRVGDFEGLRRATKKIQLCLPPRLLPTRLPCSRGVQGALRAPPAARRGGHMNRRRLNGYLAVTITIGITMIDDIIMIIIIIIVIIVIMIIIIIIIVPGRA